MRSVPTLRPGQRNAPHLGELLVGEHRARQLQAAAVAGTRIEQVAFRAQPHVDEVMISSRMQSMGGLVTCANSCLK